LFSFSTYVLRDQARSLLNYNFSLCLLELWIETGTDQNILCLTTHRYGNTLHILVSFFAIYQWHLLYTWYQCEILVYFQMWQCYDN